MKSTLLQKSKSRFCREYLRLKGLLKRQNMLPKPEEVEIHKFAKLEMHQ